MKNFWKEFKKFITRGNVVDLAVAVVVGGAFGKITTSLVNDIILPLIGMATGGVNISSLKWVIRPAVVVDGVETVTETAIRYGQFIQSVVDFLVIALFIFIALRLIMRARNVIGDISEKEKRRLFKKNKTKGDKNTPAPELATENAPAPKPETTDDILKDIRTLLQSNNAFSQKETACDIKKDKQGK